MKRCVAAFAVCLGLTSCTSVPHNVGPTNVRFAEIVKRVKCDLVGAVYTKANQDPARYGFLTQWAAKVHLTLTVDDQASFSPGLTVTDPLSVVGTSFSLGVGGTYTGQAQRTEDYEFFLAFNKAGPEMTRETVAALYNGCVFPEGVLLESDFDFGSTIERAVAPIEAGLLRKGRQVGPGSNSSPPLPANEIPNIRQALAAAANSPIIHLLPIELVQKDPARKLLIDKILSGQTMTTFQSSDPAQQSKEKEQKAKDVADAIANSPRIAQNVHEIIENVVKPLYELALTTDLPKKCNTQMQRDRASAISSSASVAINKSNIDNSGSDQPDKIIESYKFEQAARDDVLSKAQAMLDDITNCKEPPPKPATPTIAYYDPIDLIQETANFYVTISGSVAPSWKLVRISAPLGLPLFSGTAKRTHSLIVTMGRPAKDDNGAQVASRSMESNLSASLIAQAINQRLVP